MKQYIDKDIVKAEIEGLKRNTFTNFDEGVNAAAQILLDFLDTLEVKEVDLEEEMNKWRQKHFEGIDYILEGSGEWLERASQLDIAWHFFELGLKAQKL